MIAEAGFPMILPRISITTASFNSANTIARTIESVLIQEYNNVEYVIMDGGSTDGTVAIAQSYSDAFRDKGWDYRVVSESDKGMYDAINKAMSLCSGDLIGNINSDDYYEPGAFVSVVACYLVTGFDLFQGNLKVHTANGLVVKKARPMGRWISSRKWNHPTLFLAGRAREYRYRLDNPYADFDLFLRAISAGLKVFCLDEEIANFSFGGISTKKSLSDVWKRITWKHQILADNRCHPLAYIEGIAIELYKYAKA